RRTRSAPLLGPAGTSADPARRAFSLLVAEGVAAHDLADLLHVLLADQRVGLEDLVGFLAEHRLEQPHPRGVLATLGGDLQVLHGNGRRVFLADLVGDPVNGEQGNHLGFGVGGGAGQDHAQVVGDLDVVYRHRCSIHAGGVYRPDWRGKRGGVGGGAPPPRPVGREDQEEVMLSWTTREGAVV